ncbi:CBN-EOR-2 protein [Caenorhabditis brenneri]|uniref:CBN-EOR-2 protein n=1 Tax=Caenorhabditis brenneri TaxID=135651 RepID=G0MBB0_CAEBE|nr:CBN-EOR-2 protein [Caenorhabditis brenneri]
MSTLHSLQMQSMGNQMLPQSDLQCELQNQLLQKLPQTTIPQAQTDWMKNICVDSLLDPFKNKNLASTSTIVPSNPPFSLPTATLTDNAFQIAASSFLQNPIETSVITPTVQAPIPEPTPIPALESLPKEPSPEIMIIDVIETSPDKVVVPEPTPSTSEAPEKPLNTSGLDYDEAHDDVDNIFGLSLAEDDVTAGVMYRRQSSADKGLSPIAFTPPDSPQNDFTFDDLFGLPADKKDTSTTSEPKLNDTKTLETPSTSAEIVQPTTSTISSAAKDEEDEFVANYVMPKNVPVYKQRAALMSLEAREAAKKEAPNYDVFDFEDDDDFMFGGPSEVVKKKYEPPKKIELPKYIPGHGWDIQGKDHTKRWQPRQQPAPAVHHDNFNDKVFFTIADKIRTRKDEEITSCFMKPEQSSSTECAKNQRKATPQEPLLPRFIIRIDHLQTVSDEPTAVRRRYKRRKNNRSDNDDSDYDDVSYRRRKVMKKVYSLHREGDPNFRRTVLDFSIGPCVPEADRKRINAFGPAEGILPKGTYVVCKADILRDDCAVWRVDNQNLLQKFPQMRNPKTNKLVYRSSSTYSGWCEQISSQYFRVSVKIIKQTRSETTVEPEIPLAELFCASSMEFFKHPGTVNIKEPEIKKECVTDQEEEDATQACPKITALKEVLNACLTQVFTKKHVENLLEKNDWTYTRSVAEIENNNKQCEELIRKRIPVEMKHNKYIGTYTRLAVSKSSYTCLSKCQICKRKKPRRIIHFFDKASYNLNLVVDELVGNIRDENEEDRELPIVADAIACGRCSMAVDFLHKMHHLQFHILRLCEDKLEEIGTTEIDLTIEKLIDVAKADKTWMQSVMQRYCDLWDQVRYEFRDV